MLADAHRDAVLVEHGARVVRVDAVQGEGDDGGFVRCGADEAQAGQFGKRLFCGGAQGFFVRAEVGDVFGGKPVQRGAEADDFDDGRRACFKFGGRRGVEGALEADAQDHVAAALVGRHGVKQVVAAVEDADAGRPVVFVRGEGEEVAAEGLHVHRHVGDGLCGIDDSDDAARFGAGDERREVVDAAEGVGDERGGEDFDAVEQVVEVRGVERAVVVDGDDGEFGAKALAGALPGDDVGVVFERGQQDAVAGFEDEFAQGACQQVECFGGAFGEDDFFGA